MVKKQEPTFDLSTRALRVSAVLNWWVAEVTDKKVSDEVADNHNVPKKTGRYTKKLFPFEAPEYDAVTDKLREFQKYYRGHTLPWDYGERLLNSSYYGEFNGTAKEFASQVYTLNMELVKVLPEYKRRAKEQLNSLFNEADYPTQQALKDKFGITLHYMPVVAAGDFRLELDKGLLTELREQHAIEFQNTQAEMSKKLWQRIYDAVSRAAKLANDKTKIYDSVFEDLDELAEALPVLNILQDPEMDRLGNELKLNLAGRTPDIVRKDVAERADVAKKAQQLADKMKRFMA